MSNCLKAVLISFAAHALVAFALAFWIGHAAAVEIPLLDLSAVEVSFSEVEREASPAVPPPVSDTPPEPDTPPPPPVSDTPPPEPDTTPPPPVSDTPPPEPDTPPPPPASDTPPPEPDTPPPEPDTPPPPEPDTPPPPVADTPPPPVPAPPPREPDTKPEAPPPSPPPEAPKQAHVDAPPKPVKSIKPDYPKGARQRGEEGDVDLELAINANGRVESVSVVKSSGYPELDAAAIRAATKARFVPAKAGKNAISSVARITISFRLMAR